MSTLSSCSGSPIASNESSARAANVRKSYLAGTGFNHAVFAGGSGAADAGLRVYIGGDGRAHLNRHRVAEDPTPWRDVALELMLKDPGLSYFVARPCYHGTASDAGCSPELWTTGRYAPEVIASVRQVVRVLRGRHQEQPLTLIGYSGGGVVALLAALELAEPVTVVTVASPLDVDAWTGLHGYTPLVDSLSPAGVERWPEDLRQLHYAGAEDRNVPASITESFAARVAGNVTVEIVQGFDHTCCWVEAWPQLLADSLESMARDGSP